MLCSQLNDAIPALGSLNDPANRRHVQQRAGDYTVSGDHEVLDQVGCTVLLLIRDTDNLLIAEDWLNLHALDVQRGMAAGPRWRAGARRLDPRHRRRRRRGPPADRDGGAVYFCCLEAIQNAAKYAQAARIDVRLGTWARTSRSRSATTAWASTRRRRGPARACRAWPTGSRRLAAPSTSRRAGLRHRRQRARAGGGVRMTSRTAARLAWGICAVALAGAVAAVPP